jgi:hypothetical protein
MKDPDLDLKIIKLKTKNRFYRLLNVSRKIYKTILSTKVYTARFVFKKNQVVKVHYKVEYPFNLKIKK